MRVILISKDQLCIAQIFQFFTINRHFV